jgi:ubiquinone/menaquinone biosynthesis C-methylase UbiE
MSSDKLLTESQEQVRAHYSAVALAAKDGGCNIDKGCGRPLARAGLEPGQTVLDLGCGGGTELIEAARLVSVNGGGGGGGGGAGGAGAGAGSSASGAGSGAGSANGANAARATTDGHVYGLDMTSEMLGIAKERLDEAGISNATLIKGMIENIPLPDSTVDVVISNCVINLCDDKQAALAEAWRVIKPGGRMVIADIILDDEGLPRPLANTVAAVLGCTNGVLSRQDYLRILGRLGFVKSAIELYKSYSSELLRQRATAKGNANLLTYLDDAVLCAQLGKALGAAFVLATKPSHDCTASILGHHPPHPLPHPLPRSMSRSMSTTRLKAAATGELLAPDEALHLLTQAPNSLLAWKTAWAAQEMGRRLANNQGQVFAQIGVDANPCPDNCRYCSYAAINSKADAPAATLEDASAGVQAGASATAQNDEPIGSRAYNLSATEVINYARTFNKAGVHLISLMATSAYAFEDFCSLAGEVRAAISPDMPLLANIGDIDYQRACLLKQAGVDAFYHTVRFGEGLYTRPQPSARRATIEAVQRAGLRLMSGLEPLYQELTADEIVDKIYEIDAFAPLCSGACSIHIAEKIRRSGADWVSGTTPLKSARLRQIAAVARLASTERTLFGFCGGIVWVDAGADPRGKKPPTDAAALTHQVEEAKKQLDYEDWLLPEQPLAVWQGR